MDQTKIRELSDAATHRLINKPGTSSSKKGGFMMISTILIEAWDLYAIAFILIFVKKEYNPSATELALAGAAVQAGALIGALCGGVIADYLGRKKVFLITMVLFIVLALAQGFSRSIWDLIILRFLIGLPLGSDISNGYAYIMESMSKGAREQMGSLWQFMFGLGEVICVIIVALMYASGTMSPEVLWRVALALGALPALLLLLARLDLPETPLSLIQRGQFVKAKEVSKLLFNDSLDMLPNENVKVDKPKVGDFLQVIWADPIRKRATIFGWISCACQGAEFAAWGFYIPLIMSLAGVGTTLFNGDPFLGTIVMTGVVFSVGMFSGLVAPFMLPKIGHRGVAMWGYGLAFLGLIMGGFALKELADNPASVMWQYVLLGGAAVLMWGHYWDASNGMTIPSMVAPARFRATASGFSYAFVKGASFFGAFGFPVLKEHLGQSGATFAVALLSLTGFLAAKFILPEVYGYVESEGKAPDQTMAASSAKA